MKTLKELGEFNFIDLVSKGLYAHKSVIKGIGDDAAAVSVGKDKILLFTSDMLIEDVHFKRNQSPQLIGHKAIACSLSDIAAIGGEPLYALISLALPKNLEISFARRLYSGMQNTAERFNVSIVGGDTNSAEKVIIDVFMCGKANKKIISRSGAKLKDMIFVTGLLGGSQSGRHLFFSPRVEEAKFLAKKYPVNAMIDISDGLINDLSHIVKQSKKGALLFEKKIPVSISAHSMKDAFYTGEDFELLFTLPKQYTESLLKKWPFKKVKLSCIGEITKAGTGITLQNPKGKLRRIKKGGYQHFK